MAWVCALITPEVDNIARSIEPMGCSQNPLTGILSLGVLARWTARQEMSAVRADSASQLYTRYRSQLIAACNGAMPLSADLREATPVIFSDHYGRRIDEATRHVSFDAMMRLPVTSPRDWGDALVIIGQTHPQAGDLHRTVVSTEASGPALLAAFVSTAETYPPGPPPSWLFLVLCCLSFSLGASLLYLAFSEVRMRAMRRVPAPFARKIVSDVLLGPTALSAFTMAVAIYVFAQKLGPLLPVEAWREMVFCLVASLAAVTLMDLLSEDDGKKAV
jgi:hypothetical protein